MKLINNVVYDNLYLTKFDKVEQPLKPIIPPEIYQKCLDIAQNRGQMDSILTCFFEEKNEVPIAIPIQVRYKQ